MPRELQPAKKDHSFWTVYDLDHVRQCVITDREWAMALREEDKKYPRCDDHQHALCVRAMKCVRVEGGLPYAIELLGKCHKVRVDHYVFVREAPEGVPQADL